MKLAEDQSGDLIVRLYEASGSRNLAAITPNFDFKTVVVTDLLENELPANPALPTTASGTLQLELRPFKIVTLRFSRG
jgi:alpha-mannosidase